MKSDLMILKKYWADEAEGKNNLESANNSLKDDFEFTLTKSKVRK